MLFWDSREAFNRIVLVEHGAGMSTGQYKAWGRDEQRAVQSMGQG